MSEEYSKYELFSIVIHSGSAYGGHYHTYIKDTENLGNWIIAETVDDDKKAKNKQNLLNDLNSKEITLVRENLGDEDLDYLKYDTPLELLKAFLYNNHAYQQVKIESICSGLTKNGMFWNKIYKPKYGTINKFLKKNDHVFEVTQDEKLVNLKIHSKINEILSADYENFIQEKCIKRKELEELEEQLQREIEEKQLENKLDNLHLNSWFDFNDERIHAIKQDIIEKQFEGKESAYMLFYRRKNDKMRVNGDIVGKKIVSDKSKQVPSWLLNEIIQKNEQLQAERRIYDKDLNEISVRFYLDINFIVSQPNKVLQLQNEANFICLTIDKRDKIEDLKEKLVNYCTSIENNHVSETILNYILSSQYLKYLSCKQNQFGFHYISKILSENEDFSNFQQNSTIILSNNSDSFYIGEQYEPIKLIIKYYYDDENTSGDNFKRFNEFSELFTKQTTIKEIIQQLTDFTSNNKKQLTLVLLEKNKKIILNRQNGQETKLLSEYQAKNGDYLIIDDEDNFVKATTTSNPVAAHNKDQITVEIVNFVNQDANSIDDSMKFTQIELSINSTDHASDVKILAISAFSLDVVNYDECHLRYINTSNLARSDLIIELKLKKCLLSGQRLYDDDVIENIIDLNVSNLFVLCNGRAPLDNEVTLKCCCMLDNNNIGQCLIDEVECEIISKKLLSINDLVLKLVQELNLSLSEADVSTNQTYYLKTVNWMGDPDVILNNLTKTVTDVNLTNNSYLCLTKGCLVPQNHIKVNIWFHDISSTGDENSVISRKLLSCDVNLINSEFKFLNCLICKYDVKLEELKLKIIDCLNKNLNLELNSGEDNDDLIRIRILKKLIIKNNSNKKIFIEKYQLKKCLFDWHKTLKQLNLSNEVDLCVEILDSCGLNQQGIMLLDCLNFDIKTNEYSNFKSISWNINNGANLISLKHAIIKEYNLEPNDLYHIALAKRLVDKYDWIVIKESSGDEVMKSTVEKCSKRGRKPKLTTQQQQLLKSNLKNAPYNFDDGDLIAFVLLNDEESLKIATLQTITNKEFLTKFDNDFKSSQIDLNKLKKVNKGKDVLDTKNNTRKNRRAEVGIVIKTDDFN